MRIREIAFKFEDSNNIIFATFMMSSETLFFKRLIDDENVKDPREVLENYFDLNKDNVKEYEELVKVIENDKTETLFFKRLIDDENVKDPREVLENYFDLNKDNVKEYEELVKVIENDKTIIDKIKRNEKPKLLFQYEMPQELKEALN